MPVEITRTFASTIVLRVAMKCTLLCGALTLPAPAPSKANPCAIRGVVQKSFVVKDRTGQALGYFCFDDAAEDSRHSEDVRQPAFRRRLVGALDAVPPLRLGNVKCRVGIFEQSLQRLLGIHAH